ncbi:hypothetical protein [Mucisphaera calidilacus]|uniref:Uncharacterized protein n=1 Tax=Mucisphaera calidilacus TaxID=2527982 RepID=A0A518BVM5_9BACT|nr:hypothetical protein [Mucisphaera calidilacus]QDU71032.1 hypothetical protein Pan265_08770 [Mucisphaera calidilacus]
MKKVQTGDPLAIPARTYNAFIDAAVRSSFDSGVTRSQAVAGAKTATILVRNDSGYAMPRYAVVGLEGPLITPDDNLAEFGRQAAMSVVLPDEQSHRVRFVVLAEPLAQGSIGRAYLSGVCQANLMVIDPVAETYRYAGIAQGVFALLPQPVGSATIIWKQPGTGFKKALVHLTGQQQPACPMPVELTQVGGTQGDETGPATWTYDVIDPVTGATLASAVDPMSSPHRWRRPALGQVIAADFGYAHYAPNLAYGYDLVLGWINETLDTQACGS